MGMVIRTDFEERGKELEAKVRKEYEAQGEVERDAITKEFKYVSRAPS
jgi:hypothetical protein